MITKGRKTRIQTRSVAATLAIAAGLLGLWAVLDQLIETPATSGTPTVANTTGVGPFTPDAGTELRGSLDVLHVDFEPAAKRILQAARQRALEMGGIVQRSEDEVDATVRVAGEGHAPTALAARIRLKGDLNDHVDTDKWSLRIELRGGKRFGMRRFSIQHPKTRGYIAEWLIMEMARREGLLAPRGRFVDVVVNGRPSGVYYLEEHFAKELLESQGRREGPIVRFREESLWATWLQYGYVVHGRVPKTVSASTELLAAELDAFESGRLARDSRLGPALARALEQLADLQRRALELFGGPDGQPEYRRRLLDELETLKAAAIDDVLEPVAIGKMLAIAALWTASHGLGWHQLRFYHDPVRDRLEPVLFDMGADVSGLQQRASVLLEHPLIAHLLVSDVIRETAWHELWRLAQPGERAAFFASIAADVTRYWPAVGSDPTTVPPGLGGPDRFDDFVTVFQAHADWLCELLVPRDPLSCECRLVLEPSADGSEDDRLIVEVDAWATTRVPVRVRGFRLSNGRFVAAAGVRANAPVDTPAAPGRAGTLLPAHGRPQRFRFPADARLASLRRIQAIKRAVRAAASAGDGAANLEISVEYERVTDRKVLTEPLRMVRIGADPRAGRPAPPTLQQAVETHPFLALDLERGELRVRAGDWNVEGDLVVPKGWPLVLAAGATLRFGPDAVCIVEAALRAEGSETEPARLLALDPTAGWGGLVVLDAPEMSRCRHLHIAGASEIVRGGWQTTGGVTFYRSPVRFEHVRIEGARGEDALNVFGARCELVDSSFDGGPSDLFDGDFVQGEILRCTFTNSGEDAVDVSGSRVTVRDCHFGIIGDKAVSVGEDSDVDVLAARIDRCSIAVASKDDSRVVIDGLAVGVVENYTLAAYIKKPEYGPASIDARNVSSRETGRGLHIAQTGCTVSLDGVDLPTRDLDVDALYRQKVLGK